MSIDWGVPGGPCQIIALSVGDVLPVFLDVHLGQSKVDQEDLVSGYVATKAEVVWFDISVEEVPTVDILNSRNHLIHEHENGLEGELAVTLKETLKGRAQQVHHEHVVVAWVGEGVPSVEQ